MSDFSFIPITKSEQAKLDLSKRELAQKSKEALEATATCLSMNQFAKYREEYAHGKEELIQAGIKLDYSNPIVYSQLAHDIFMRIDFMGKLEELIQRDLRKVNKG